MQTNTIIHLNYLSCYPCSAHLTILTSPRSNCQLMINTSFSLMSKEAEPVNFLSHHRLALTFIPCSSNSQYPFPLLPSFLCHSTTFAKFIVVQFNSWSSNFGKGCPIPLAYIKIISFFNWITDLIESL